jgi:hypothetical protein
VATYSTGIAVTFNGVAFEEVTDLAWSFGGGLPKGRSVIWTDDVGSLTLTCLGGANLSTSLYGTRADLAVSGGGQSLTCKAVYEGLSVAPQLNGVTQYSVSFKLLDG